MTTIRRPAPTTISLLLLAAACTQAPAPATGDMQLEELRDPITSLSTGADGDTWVAFGAGARSFVIPRERADLLAVARDAFAHGTPVRATVRAGHGPKTAASATAPVDAADRRRIEVVKLERD